MPSSAPQLLDPTLQPEERPAKSLRRVWVLHLDRALKFRESAADEEELVHRFRVTLKRLRGLLQLLRPSMTENRWRRKDRELRDLGRKLASARNAAVAEKTRQKIAGAAAVPEEETEIKPIPAGEALLTVAARLERLRNRPLSVPKGFQGWRLIREGVCQTYAHARLEYRRWRHSGELSAAHECRKYVKYLLYQLEWIEPLDPEPLGKLRTGLDELGQVLGNLNDLAEFARHPAVPEEAEPAREALAKATPVAMKMTKELLKKSPSHFVNRLRAARRNWRKSAA